MRQSWVEGEFALLLEFNRIEYFKNLCVAAEDGSEFEFDFFLPDYNVAVEIDGCFHAFTLERDLQREMLAEREKLTLFRVFPKLGKLARTRQYEDVLARIRARDFSKLKW